MKTSKILNINININININVFKPIIIGIGRTIKEPNLKKNLIIIVVVAILNKESKFRVHQVPNIYIYI